MGVPVSPANGSGELTPRPDPVRLERLAEYERRTSIVMLVLALLYMVLYAVEVLATGLPGWAGAAVEATSNVIWALFAIDLLTRVVLAPRRLEYLLRHPVDVVAVIVPMFRFLRVLRVITAGHWLISRGKRLAVGRTAAALFVAVSFLALVGGLAVLDAEAGAPGAHIVDFGDAVWWALATMSTVGYGDVYPVTVAGRVVAIGMMTVGVSLLGVVSATMAAGFLAQTQAEQEDENAAVLHRLEHLEGRITELTTMLGAAWGAAPAAGPSSSAAQERPG